MKHDPICRNALAAPARATGPRVMLWPYDLWLRSEVRLLGSREVRAVAFDLFCIAQGETPAGTLPRDQRILAAMAGEAFEDWQALMRQTPNPLTGWTLLPQGKEPARYRNLNFDHIARGAL